MADKMPAQNVVDEEKAAKVMRLVPYLETLSTLILAFTARVEAALSDKGQLT